MSKKKKKKGKMIHLKKDASAVDIQRAVLFAYFNDVKPEDLKQRHAYKLLAAIAQYNLSKN